MEKKPITLRLNKEEKDNKIERLQSIVASLSTSIQHLKLDYEKNEKSRRLLFSMV
jgi:hypothetical protein